MQGDELQQMTVLARDAAEILFEMAAMQDKSPEAHDMLEKSQQIEVGCMTCNYCGINCKWILATILIAPQLQDKALVAGGLQGRTCGHYPFSQQHDVILPCSRHKINQPRCSLLYTQVSKKLRLAFGTGSTARDDWRLQGR